MRLDFKSFPYKSGGRICYLLMPQGLTAEAEEWLEAASESYAVSAVVITGMDWNDDLTPWPADGVFRKAKPFGGKAEEFLKELTAEIERFESDFGPVSERYLLGISLSGLFAVWAAFQSDFFSGIISISGSLWYDGFAEWAAGRVPVVKDFYISLGDREKNSKDRRMCTVQDATESLVKVLQSSGVPVRYILEADTTHFSPIVPRLQMAFEKTFTS